MNESPIQDRIVIVTDGARRVGHALALASTQAGSDVVLHFCQSAGEAEVTRGEIEALGRRAWTIHADLSMLEDARDLVESEANFGALCALVNNAAVFRGCTLRNVRLSAWDRHVAVNLTAPFVLTQAFAAMLDGKATGRVINVLDRRALRPGSDHFPYTVTKAALAAMTRSLPQAHAPTITVNGLALGAILPSKTDPAAPGVLAEVPAGRWGSMEEVRHAMRFLLGGPGT